MAIDTAAKRASVAGMIIPDGTLDQGDRQTIAGFYGGILATAAVAVDFVKITALTAVEYVAQTLTAAGLIDQAVTAGEYIVQTVTVEDS